MSGAKKRDDDAALSYLAAAALEQGERPSKLIVFPGLGKQVRLVIPTSDELTTADVESRKRLTKDLQLTALELTLAQETTLAERERHLALLALILRHPDDVEEAVVDDADDLRKLIGDRERKALMAALADFERERFESRTPEESAEIVRLLKNLKADGALSTFLMSCDGDIDRLTLIVEALVDAVKDPTAPSSSDR